jgi:hypothetical protein
MRAIIMVTLAMHQMLSSLPDDMEISLMRRFLCLITRLSWLIFNLSSLVFGVSLMIAFEHGPQQIRTIKSGTASDRWLPYADTQQGPRKDI